MTAQTQDVVQKLRESGQTLAEHAGLSRDATRVLYANAVGHYEAGRLRDACKTLFQLVALDPHAEDHWALYGNALMKMGQFAEAVTAWEMAMVCTPRYGTAATIARTAIAIGQFERAAEALVMARKLAGTDEQRREFDALVDAWHASRAG